MKALYILSRLIQVVSVLLMIAGATVIGMDWLDVSQMQDVEWAFIAGGIMILFGYVGVLCSRGLDYCLRHTPWIENYVIEV